MINDKLQIARNMRTSEEGIIPKSVVPLKYLPSEDLPTLPKSQKEILLWPASPLGNVVQKKMVVHLKRTGLFFPL